MAKLRFHVLTEVKLLNWRKQACSHRDWLRSLIVVKRLKVVPQDGLQLALAHGLAVGIHYQTFTLDLVRLEQLWEGLVLDCVSSIEIICLDPEMVIIKALTALACVIGRLLLLHDLALTLLQHAADVVLAAVARLGPRVG